MASGYIPSVRLAFQCFFATSVSCIARRVVSDDCCSKPVCLQSQKKKQLLGLNALQLQNSDGDFGVKD